MGAVRVTSGRLIIGARALYILAADVATRSLWSVTVTHENDILVILMFSKILILTGLAAAGLLLYIVNSITPSEAGASGIFAVFILGYVVLLSLITFFIWFVLMLVRKLGEGSDISRRVAGLTLVKTYYYSSVFSLGVVILVSLQSIGTVGFREYLLVTLLVLLGCLYVTKRTT